MESVYFLVSEEYPFYLPFCHQHWSLSLFLVLLIEKCKMILSIFLEGDCFGRRLPWFLFACGLLVTIVDYQSAPRPPGLSEGCFVGHMRLGVKVALVLHVLCELFPDICCLLERSQRWGADFLSGGQWYKSRREFIGSQN